MYALNYFLLSLIAILPIYIQNADALQNESAKAILDKVAERYVSKNSIEVGFEFNIQLADRPERKEKGTMVQDGEKFRIISEAQHIYCDETAVWYYLVEDNEVQINDYDGDDSGEMGFVSPKDLLRQYQSGAFEYGLLDIQTKIGQSLARIEFKPNDQYSDYSKLRITIEQGKSAIEMIEAFGKDGSRYAMNVVKETFGKSYTDGFFTFDAALYPDVYIEDLRID